MREEITNIQELQINYKIAGEGPAILILHGWGRGSDAYAEVSEKIAEKGYRVVVPDLPGFGKSPPPSTTWGIGEYTAFVKRFSQALNLHKFILLGHSFGGQIAVKFVVEHPEDIEKLILYAAAAIRKPPNMKIKTIQTIARLGNALFSIFPLSFLRPLFRKAFYRLFGISSALYAKGIMKEIREKMVRDDQSHLLSRIEVPTLILWGDKDVSTPISDGEFIKNQIPNAIFKVFPGATHLLHQEMPEQFVESILQFLQSQKT